MVSAPKNSCAKQQVDRLNIDEIRENRILLSSTVIIEQKKDQDIEVNKSK